MKLTAVRIFFAFVLLLAAGLSLRPQLTSYVSTSALVNAPLINISAPFNGSIETASMPVARPINEGETLFVLENARSQRMALQTLKSELGAISGQISGLERQMEELEELKEVLISRREAKIEARRKWFTPKLEETRWSIAKAEADFERATDVYARLTTLAEKGNAREFDLIDARARKATAKAELAGAKAMLRRMEIEEQTLDGAVGVDMTSDDLEQIEYRIDEIAIRNADIDARLLGLQTRRAGLKTEISRASIESSRQEKFMPIATTSGIVWNASPGKGTPISDGEQIVEILDCSRRFLEVVLPERHFEKVPAGTKAWVKLKGSSKTFAAEVVATYGSGARPNRAMQAASPRIEIDDGIRVIVSRMGSADLTSYEVVRSFCDVGRAAEVRFDMDESLSDRLVSLFYSLTGQTSTVLASNDS